MIVSRLVARRRIAAGQRPGRVAAWSLVLLDAMLLGLVFLLIVPPLLSLANGLLWLKIVLLFAVVFLPLQAVLIVSALWAAKSRWNLDSVEEL